MAKFYLNETDRQDLAGVVKKHKDQAANLKKGPDLGDGKRQTPAPQRMVVIGSGFITEATDNPAKWKWTWANVDAGTGAVEAAAGNAAWSDLGTVWVPSGGAVGQYGLVFRHLVDGSWQPAMFPTGTAGIGLNLYGCDNDEAPACTLDALPFYSATVTALYFKSTCLVGDVIWSGGDGPNIFGKVWTLAGVAGSDWTFNSETETSSETMPAIPTDNKPITSLWFADGLQGSGGNPEFETGVLPDGAVEFSVSTLPETRTDNGVQCGGKILKITGSVATHLLVSRWDPNPNDAANIQNPTKDIYFKNTSNGGTLPNKTQGITFTITKTPADRKIQVEAKGAIAMGDLANVDDVTASVDVATKHTHLLAWDNENNRYVRIKKITLQVVTEDDVRWDTTNAKLQKRSRALTVWGIVGSPGDWVDIDAAENCT